MYLDIVDLLIQTMYFRICQLPRIMHLSKVISKHKNRIYTLSMTPTEVVHKDEVVTLVCETH